MKAVAIFAFLIATTADFVPNAGPYLALVASALAVYGFPASAKLGFATILYAVMGTMIYAPGFLLSDMATGNYGGTSSTGGASGTGDASVDAVVSNIGSLATGTAPDGFLAGAGYEPLSSTVITILVTLHIVALIAGIRRKFTYDAQKARHEEDWEFE